MQNEDIPSGADSSEQNLNRAGAPGPTVTVPDGPYRIYTALSSSTPMVVNMATAQEANQTYKVRLTYEAETLSTWTFIYNTARSHYRIHNFSPLVLGRATTDIDDVVGVSAEEGAPEQLTQFWVLKDAGPGIYYIESVYDGRLIEVKNASTANNTNIIVAPYTAATKQRFRLERVRPTLAE